MRVSSFKVYEGLSNAEVIRLLQDGPLAIAVSSGDWENYGSGTFTPQNAGELDHIALLVGYTQD